jgi:hypothetical protein
MKRKRRSHHSSEAVKRQRLDDNKQASITPLLQQYYHGVHTLRTYLVSRLPRSSKKRRRRLLHYGLQPIQDESIIVCDATVQLLDTILVGTAKDIPTQELEQLDQDISVFTQQVSESDVSISPSAGHLKQSEVGSSCFRLLTRTDSTSRPATELMNCRSWISPSGPFSIIILELIDLHICCVTVSNDPLVAAMEQKPEPYPGSLASMPLMITHTLTS